MKKTKQCSNCIHAASKNRHINTIPSIHTCMNEKAKCYLEDSAWSHTCSLWGASPPKFTFKDICGCEEYYKYIDWEDRN